MPRIKKKKKPLPTSANFIDGNGKEGNGVYAVLPICQYADSSKRLINFIGTAFFIKRNEVFLTAKHVVEDQNGNFLHCTVKKSSHDNGKMKSIKQVRRMA